MRQMTADADTAYRQRMCLVHSWGRLTAARSSRTVFQGHIADGAPRW
ncbi:hypothetical protein [Streptomyces sp. NPDC059080]